MGTDVKRKAQREKALTLLETLIASAILTIVVVAVSQAIVAGQMQVYDALHRARALELAEALMDEVLRLPYDDPDGLADAGRANFDNTDDFDAFTEAAGTLADAAGVAYEADYQVFSRSVTVVSGSETVSGFGDPLPGVHVTVTVQDGAGTSWVLQQFVPQPPE